MECPPGSLLGTGPTAAVYNEMASLGNLWVVRLIPVYYLPQERRTAKLQVLHVHADVAAEERENHARTGHRDPPGECRSLPPCGAVSAAGTDPVWWRCVSDRLECHTPSDDSRLQSCSGNEWQDKQATSTGLAVGGHAG